MKKIYTFFKKLIIRLKERKEVKEFERNIYCAYMSNGRNLNDIEKNPGMTKEEIRRKSELFIKYYSNSGISFWD